MRRKFDPEALLRDALVRETRLQEAGQGEDSAARFDIRIDRHGNWHYRGSRIDRVELVKLFASILRRAEDGTYWLVTPAEQGRIEVDDVPFTLVEMDAIVEHGRATFSFRSNLGEWTKAGVDNPIVMRERFWVDGAVPYLVVRDGLEGRMVQSVYYALADRIEMRAGRGGVWSGGMFHPLGDV